MTGVDNRESLIETLAHLKTLDQAPPFQSPCLARKAIAGVQNDSGAGGGGWWGLRKDGRARERSPQALV